MYDIIRNYIPVNEQEIRDKAIMLQLAREPRINREDPGHFTVRSEEHTSELQSR